MAEVEVDSNGASYHQHHDPFGKVIDSPTPELARIGFTGHDHDLGLIDMKGRVYDPLAGRFLTADPITQAPFWSQGLNRYSYVFNNPVNNTDPSGFEATGDDNGVQTAATVMGWVGGLTGFAAGGGLGLGSAALNPLTSAFMPSIGDAVAGSTHVGAAPSAAPRGSGVGVRHRRSNQWLPDNDGMCTEDSECGPYRTHLSDHGRVNVLPMQLLAQAVRGAIDLLGILWRWLRPLSDRGPLLDRPAVTRRSPREHQPGG